MKNTEREVMDHVVLDPDAWITHATNVFGEEQALIFLAAKVARWKPEFDREKNRPGYKKRTEREAK